MHDATIAAPTLVESSQIFLTVCASKHQGRVEVAVLHVQHVWTSGHYSGRNELGATTRAILYM